MRKNDPTQLLAQYEAIWANAVVGAATTNTTEDNESVHLEDSDSSENSIFVTKTTKNAARDCRMSKADQQDVDKVSDGVATEEQYYADCFDISRISQSISEPATPIEVLNTSGSGSFISTFSNQASLLDHRRQRLPSDYQVGTHEQ